MPFMVLQTTTRPLPDCSAVGTGYRLNHRTTLVPLVIGLHCNYKRSFALRSAPRLASVRSPQVGVICLDKAWQAAPNLTLDLVGEKPTEQVGSAECNNKFSDRWEILLDCDTCI